MPAPRSARAPRRPDGAPLEVPHRYVGSEAALDALVAELLEAPAYALDTEFHRERTYYPRLALLQVAWGGQVALVDPLVVEVRALAAVLSGPGLAVLHAADQDLEVLDRACGVVPNRLVDTQLCAGFVGFASPSLGTLVERVLGIRLEKGDQLTDWTRRPLTDTQRRYAASDVAHLLELWDALRAQLEAAGRLEWAEQECALLLERPRAAVDPDEAWWRLKHARQLRGRDRGVAQAVAAWRERRAAELDVPTRFIMSDLALGAIAHRPPTTRAELEHVRGVDARQLGGGAADALLAAIEAGRALAPEALRLPPPPTGEAIAKPAVALVSAWTAERARALGIDPGILATRADLVAFLQDPPGGRLQHSWRAAYVGEPIRRLVAGEASLALSGGALVLEERSRRPYVLDTAARAEEVDGD